MKNLVLLSGLAAFAALSFHAMTASAAITISEVTFSGPGGVTLNGVLYAPDGFDMGSDYSAVVMMHGCSGMWSNSIYQTYSGGNPNLQNHIDKWGIKLANEDVVALAVDSYSARTPTGVDVDDYQHQCSGNTYAGAVNPYTTRASDARYAYDYLTSTYSQIDDAHVGLLGWSQGAEAVMVQAADMYPTSNTSRPSGDKVFSATVVYYPGCGLALDFTDTSSVGDSYWLPYSHFRMNIGESDSLFTNCDTRMDIATAASTLVGYESYPGAGHSFDGGSQTWPTSTCGTADNTCAMYDSDIDSWSFFQTYL